ncbi:MAG: ACP S-malonyltransferase [Endomicrobium sp.]|jgi:[acyl-carrier-protein] S-malonyltransferase|nr:ACP S-malonyltransferase [Endomicrobium sp.]
MSKIALIFPGQGAQTIGMGKDLYNRYQRARDIIDFAGHELRNIIFNGPEEILKLTKYAQPAIFTVSVAAFEVFREFYDITTDSKNEFVAAGHSLGEYSALCSAGFFKFSDGLNIVRARGEFIQKASENNPGTMLAILGMEKSAVENLCKEVSTIGVCEAVNFNSVKQIVVAGTIAAINRVAEIVASFGAKSVSLNVSGPFHSSLMISASDSMAKELEKYNFYTPSFGIYTNYDALLTTNISDIKQKLVKQIKSPVKWDDIMHNIIAAGYNQFIEIGPGKVLSGLLRKIDRSKKVFNIEDSASLKKTIKELKINETL